MHIGHVALYVKELEQAKEFFVKYFQAEIVRGYHNPNTNFRSYFLGFDSGTRLEIMNRPDMTESEKQLFQAGFHHISFTVGSKEQVDALTAKLKADGYEVVSGPRTTGDGYYESCVRGFEDNLIEIAE